MNLDQLKRNLDWWVHLEPVPCRLDEHGQQLPSRRDDWAIRGVTEAGVEISNIQTGHVYTLGKDHIHHFTSDPDQSAHQGQRGFLTLTVQMYVQGAKIWIRPTRPGEALPPPTPPVEDKWVDMSYIRTSGIQANLENQGYRLLWCSDSNLARKIDLEGWEVVVLPDKTGALVRFRIQTRPDSQTLLKKRRE